MTERKAPAAADTPDPRTSEPYSLPPKDRTWSKVSEQAKAKFEASTRCDDWGLTSCLMGMGRIWFEIVGFDHESDHYTKYATNIELIWYYCYESRRLWNLNEPKWPKIARFDLLGTPCTSVADGSIEFFDMVVVDVLDAIRGEVRLVNETSVNQEWAAQFSKRLSQRLERLGVANKPVDALKLLKILERDLPAERTEATSAMQPAANIATTDGETSCPEADRFADLKDSERKAYLAHQYAEMKQGRRLTDPDAWEYLNEYGIDLDGEEFKSYELPLKTTYADYMNRARRKLNELKYVPRGSRANASRSVKKRSEI